MRLLTAAALLVAISGPVFADDAKPKPAFPPAHYTIDLTADQISQLLAIFPTAEMPQTHWGPLQQDIIRQIGEQNDAARKPAKPAVPPKATP